MIAPTMTAYCNIFQISGGTLTTAKKVPSSAICICSLYVAKRMSDDGIGRHAAKASTGGYRQ